MARLVNKLGRTSTSVVVHVNAKSDIAPFKKLVPEFCHWVEQRVPVTWGTSSLFEATLAALEYSLKITNADRFVLLSQSCFPVQTLEQIQIFFDEQPTFEFIGLRPMKNWGIDRWRLSFDLQNNRLPPVLQKGIIGKVFRRTGYANPSLDWQGALYGLQPFMGCLWWSLTRKACEYLLRFLDERQIISQYSQNLFGPEEIIPHTILGNSHFSSNIRHHVTFEDWSRGGPSPRCLDTADVEKIFTKGFVWSDTYGDGTPLFARKFGGISGDLACAWIEDFSINQKIINKQFNEPRF